MWVLSPFMLSSSGFVCGLLFVLQFLLSTACLVCTSNFLSFTLLHIIAHITVTTLSNSIFCILNNARPLPGTTKNLHLTDLSVYFMLTEYIPSCSMFDKLHVLSTADLFILAFNSAIVDLGNSIFKIQNGIIFPSLPVSISYAIFTLFWLVLRKYDWFHAMKCQAFHTH